MRTCTGTFVLLLTMIVGIYGAPIYKTTEDERSCEALGVGWGQITDPTECKAAWGRQATYQQTRADRYPGCYRSYGNVYFNTLLDTGRSCKQAGGFNGCRCKLTCPAGTFVHNGKACKPCPAGTYAIVVGGYSACKPCASGEVSIGGTGECITTHQELRSAAASCNLASTVQQVLRSAMGAKSCTTIADETCAAISAATPKFSTVSNTCVAAGSDDTTCGAISAATPKWDAINSVCISCTAATSAVTPTISTVTANTCVAAGSDDTTCGDISAATPKFSTVSHTCVAAGSDDATCRAISSTAHKWSTVSHTCVSCTAFDPAKPIWDATNSVCKPCTANDCDTTGISFEALLAGRCDNIILSELLCQKASREEKQHTYPLKDQNSVDAPYGCYYNKNIGYLPSRLWLNTLSTSTMTCQSGRECLCIVYQ